LYGNQVPKCCLVTCKIPTPTPMTRSCTSTRSKSQKDALVREILERVASKWTLLVIDTLGEEELRFSNLRARIGGVSQKVLTATLRQLERDGLVARRIRAQVPLRVEYKLTPLGLSLGESLCGVWLWVEAHMEEVERARRAFDPPAANKAPGA
jgi:DNA-binding HxlR family transcriptional regulator